MSVIRTGKCKWFNPEKGYGFLSPDGGGKDIFLHVNVVRKAGVDPDSVKEGDAFSFAVESGTKGDKATSLTRM